MKVKYQRGSSQFIVEDKEEFFLVNLNDDEVVKANPSDRPDMFLRFGYFEVVDEKGFTATTLAKISQKFIKR